MTAPPLRIGWIGLGTMGAPMATHLLEAGHDLVVHTRTRSRAEPIIARGALWAGTPAEAAEGAHAVFSIVSLPPDVEAVHLGADGTLAARALPRYVIDLTTSRPTLAARIHEVARSRGVGSLDAPVSGGDVGARSATLSIMVGGDDADVEAVRPLLDRLGGKIVHQGPAGSGQHAKMVNQILIAANMVGVSEGLLYARRAGLDPGRVLQSVGAGAAASWSLNTLGPKMIDRDFAPGFTIEHFLKDLAIALEEAARLRLALPGLALARQLYEAARAQGYEQRATQALVLALETLNGEHACAAPEKGGLTPFSRGEVTIR